MAAPAPHVLVILGSSRDARFGNVVAQWFLREVEKRHDLRFTLADARDWQLRYYNRSKPASLADYEDDDEARRWADVVGAADGFVIVTPEYNRGYPAVLKSLLDAVYAEWVRKPVAFVTYGGWSGGSRAAEQLRQVVIELQMAPIRNGLVLQFAQRLFNDAGELHQPEPLTRQLGVVLDDLAWWTKALKTARETEPAAGA